MACMIRFHITIAQFQPVTPNTEYSNNVDVDGLYCLQGFVQAAYVIMTAQEVGFDYDFEHILSTINSENVLVPGASVLKDYFHEISTNKSVSLDLFQVFFNFDIYFVKTFGLNYKNESMSFEYDNLCNLSTEELVHIKSLIDRIQLLMVTSIFCVDFRVALKRLEQCQPENFIDGLPEFDYSKINSVRVRFILAIYKSTIVKKFMKNTALATDFRIMIYAWLFHKIELISKILKPSQKSIDDSKFFSSLYIPSNDIFFNNKRIIQYFRLYFTISQPSYNTDLIGYRRRIYNSVMMDCRQWWFFNSYYCLCLHLKVRKTFFNFLLGSIEVDKWGRAINTKEFLFLKHLEICFVNLSSHSFASKGTNTTYYETLQVRSLSERESEFKAFKKKWIKYYLGILSSTILPLLMKHSCVSPVAQIMFPSPRLLNLFMLLIDHEFEFRSKQEMKRHRDWTANFMVHTYSWIKNFERLD